MIDLTRITAVLFTGLMAGLFFAYSVSVSLGLGKLENKAFLNAMKQINREIQNPLFFLCFFGSLIVLAFAVFYCRNQPFFTCFLGAFLCYAIGVFGVTVFVNVPLNNQLDQFSPAASTEIAATQMRNIFEKRWNFWNHIRTVCAVLSLLFSVLACIKSK